VLIIALVVLQNSGFGRYVYVIGNSKDAARYSGVNVRRVKLILFVASGLISALAGLLLAARLGSMRGDTATGTELTVITMVVLGGVSIFGGTGSLYGVLLSILIVLNLRNGMGFSTSRRHSDWSDWRAPDPVGPRAQHHARGTKLLEPATARSARPSGRRTERRLAYKRFDLAYPNGPFSNNLPNMKEDRDV